MYSNHKIKDDIGSEFVCRPNITSISSYSLEYGKKGKRGKKDTDSERNCRQLDGAISGFGYW